MYNTNQKNTYLSGYLNEIHWDGKKRVKTWMTKYCGIRDSQKIREAGELLLTSSVKAILSAGRPFDAKVALIGAPGGGKTRVLEILSGEKYFYEASLLDFKRTPASYKKLNSNWIVELSEIGNEKINWAKIKSLITLKSFVYREKYQKTSENHRVSFVPVFTLNSMTVPEELLNSRRFITVSFEKPVDEKKMEKLKIDRDQLFAEAVYITRKGETR